MKKKCLMLVMAGIMCFNFIGCSSEKTQANSDYDVQEALNKYKDEKGKNSEETTHETDQVKDEEELFVEAEGILIESEKIEREHLIIILKFMKTKNRKDKL